MTSPAQMQQAKKARTEQPEATPAAEAAAAGAASSTAGAAAAGAGAAAGLAASNVEKVWAKGTGYGYNAHGPRGTSSGPIWDAKAAAAAQEAQDEQINSVLQALAAALLQEFPSSSSETEQPAAAGAGSSSSGARRQQAAASLSPSQESCLAALQDSVLRPLLAREMSHVAFSELVTRQQYYKPLLSIVQAMCHPALEPLLAGNAAAEEQEAAAAAAAAAGSSSRGAGQRVVSIVGAVRGLQKGAAIVKKQLTKALEAPAAATSSRVNKEAGETG